MTDDSRLPTSRRSVLAATGATVGGLALSAGFVGADTGDGSAGEPYRQQNSNARRYRVTVANLTDWQPFTPAAVAAHRDSVEVFSVGDEANEPTNEIAENGNLQPLVQLIQGTDAIRGSAVGTGPDGQPAPIVPASDPGDTGLPYYQELHLEADASAGFLTFIAMLIATNDGFVGLDTVPLPERVNSSVTYYAQGYDAGTEVNTENFEDIVPPAQTLTGETREGIDGRATSHPDLAEGGVITPHPGISGVGDLPEKFDWDEPAASVVVERIA